MSEAATLEERREFLASMNDALRFLETDLVLQQKGFRYSYVADFSAIYAYIYKTFEPQSVSSLQGESEERVFARRQLALRLIFSDANRPVLLIPPYAAELRNHLNVVSMQVRLVGMDVREGYREKLRQLIEQSDEFRNFLIIRKLGIAHAPGKLPSAALEVGKQFFPELYALVACSVSGGLTTLRDLFDREILRGSEHELQGMQDFSYPLVKESADRWYQAIIERRRDSRAYQSFADALACAYVELANQRLNPNGHIVVFVSPSGHVRATIGRQDLIRVRLGPELPAVRDLNYFFLGFALKYDLNKVRESLHLTNELLRLYDDSGSQSDSLGERGRQILIDSASQWNRAENHFLLSDSALLKDLSSVPPRQQSIEESFLVLLHKMSEAAIAETAGLEREAEELLSGLRNDIIALDRSAPATRITQILGNLRVHRLAKGIRITFPPLPDELGTTIEFYDHAVALLAKRLHGLTVRKSKQIALTLRAQIMDLASGENAEPEHTLLAAYVLAMESKLDAALTELNKWTSTSQDVDVKELFYLAAVIQRKLSQPLDAKRLIHRALKEDEEEPRFNLECGRIYWQLSLQARGQEYTALDEESLHKAMLYFRRAAEARSKRPYRAEFWAQIENALAYLRCEMALLKGSPPAQDLGLAEDHLSKLRETISEDKWIGRFYDTSAWVSYAKATLSVGLPEAERVAILEKAAAEINKAIKLWTSGGVMDNVLKSHKKRIDEAIQDSTLNRMPISSR
jgi:hypothetical protein